MSYQYSGNKNNDMSSLSWWLKEGVFMGSGLWPGYWLRSCEDWFQCRYHSIMQQDPRNGLPRLSNHWQNGLKFDKKVKQLRVANTAAAKKYLVQSGPLNEVRAHLSSSPACLLFHQA